MKNFKNLSQLFEYFKKIHSYKGRNVFDVEHSIVRFKERFPDLDMKDYYKTLEEGIDLIMDVFKDSSGKFIIVSRSKKIAIQLEWRKDTKSKDNLNHGFTATTLHSEDQDKVLKKDTKIKVESIEDDYKFIEVR